MNGPFLCYIHKMKVLENMIVRHDKTGSGKFSEKHPATDFLTLKNEPVFAPFDGLISKQAYFNNNRKFTGLHIVNEEGIKIKLYFMQPVAGLIGSRVKEGQIIGHAQDNSEEKVKQHIHIEITKNGENINPVKYFELEPK